MIVDSACGWLVVKLERVSTIIDYQQLSSTIMFRLNGAFKHNSPWACIRESLLLEGYLRMRFGGLILGEFIIEILQYTFRRIT